MIKMVILIALFFSSFDLSAQDSTKIKHIQQFMEVTGSAKLGMQVLTNVVAAYKNIYPEAGNEFWDEFIKEVDPQAMVNLVIPVYERNFSDEDIVQLIAFYKTPLGKKVVEKMPAIMQESMQIGAAWGKQMSEKVMEKLKQKGYIKNS
jgi:hypothetical protein